MTHRFAKRKALQQQIMDFPEFLEFGKENSVELVAGKPWAFQINECSVTHCNDELYKIDSEFDMTPQHMLIIGFDGRPYTLSISEFNERFEVVL